jgi:hypothetical protein
MGAARGEAVAQLPTQAPMEPQSADQAHVLLFLLAVPNGEMNLRSSVFGRGGLKCGKVFFLQQNMVNLVILYKKNYRRYFVRWLPMGRS